MRGEEGEERQYETKRRGEEMKDEGRKDTLQFLHRSPCNLIKHHHEGGQFLGKHLFRLPVLAQRAHR